MISIGLGMLLFCHVVVAAFCADSVNVNPQRQLHHPPYLATVSTRTSITTAATPNKKWHQQRDQQQRYNIESQEAFVTVPHMVLFHEEDTKLAVEDDALTKKQATDNHSVIVTTTTTTTTKSTPSVSSKRSLVLQFGSATLACVALGAKLGLIDGYDTNSVTILQDMGASIFTGVLGYAFVKAVEWLVATQRLEPRDARKVVHTLSAPLFILFWPIFSNNSGARFFAGVVTMVNALRLILAAQGGEDERGLAKTLSRSGNAQEALGGPFVYILILQAAIWLFWRSSAVGVVALTTMAAGDGLADLVGRRLGKSNKWWFSPNKSIAGSLAFWIASTLCGVGLVSWLHFAGCLELPATLVFSDVAIRIAGISAVSALLELLPVGDDNWTVPLSAAAMAFLLFQ